MLKKILFFFFFPGCLFSQVNIDTTKTIDAYLNHFRANRAILTDFFKQMPKGGDLHHHYSGSVPMEIYVNYVLENFWVEPNTLAIKENKPKGKGNWMNFEALIKNNMLDQVRNNLIQNWSVREFPGIDPSEHFFDSFVKFSLPENNTFEEGLLALKQIAVEENVHYLETMFRLIDCDLNFQTYNQRNTAFLNLADQKDSNGLRQLLNTIFAEISQTTNACALRHNEMIKSFHTQLKLDDENFTIRYMNFILRVLPPLNVFGELVTAFQSAEESNLVVGVNIVAPEHHYIAIRDYWLHMQFFAFLKEQFPNVKVAMHAGELTPDIANPIDLNFHITDAVTIAGANRIGHGVGIAYEEKSKTILNKMKEEEIAIEINLTSNEFILGVKEEQHPVSVYYYQDVPIVICTDDAGVLRTTLTDQYTLLCQRYAFINYASLKEISFNSIAYSFIEEKELKKTVWNRLELDFKLFEEKIIKEISENDKLKFLVEIK